MEAFHKLDPCHQHFPAGFRNLILASHIDLVHTLLGAIWVGTTLKYVLVLDQELQLNNS